MALEEAVQRRAEGNKAVAKGTKAMRLVAAVTEADLTAGHQVPTREFVDVTSPAEGEETALRLLDRAAAAAESFEKSAALFAGTPGDEPLVEALRGHAAFFKRLRTEAAEFVAATRRTASLPVVEEEPESPKSSPGEEGEGMAPGVRESGRRESRKRRRNGRYFGPEWST